MSSKVLSAILALTVAACSQAPAQDKSAATTDTAPASELLAAGTAPNRLSAEDDEAAVRAAALALYASYSDLEGSAASDDVAVFTPEFEAVWDRAVGGPEFAMDFDPFCDCQDPEGLAGANVETVDVAGDIATVGLTLKWPDSSPRKQLTFKRVGGKWLLDDLSSGEWTSLHRAMAEAEPGSWGIG